MNHPSEWQLQPWDEHNRRLAGNGHPESWKNPKPAAMYNLVAMGGGTAGIISALGTAGLGGKAALIEKRLLGGDCLNFGCVPSKALIASSRAIHAARHLANVGGRIEGRVVADFSAVMERMRQLRASISHHDSAQRFSSLGVDVFLGDARFVGPRELEVAGETLRFRSAVIATGGRAAVPNVPGLNEIGFYTNETIFSLTELPARLAVIGAGPIGCELAQVFARLGSQVTVVNSSARILPKEDAEAAALVQASMEADGIRFVLGAKVVSAAMQGTSKALSIETSRGAEELLSDAILVAAGRKPNIENLGLEAAGVSYNALGIETNDYLQSSNPVIYAAGDVAGRAQFTHAADAMARICIQNALFWGRGRFSRLNIPRTTYTEPEIAHVGVTPDEAAKQGIPLATHRADLKNVDRSILDGHTSGFAKIYTKEGTSRVLGATVVGPSAGEMIGEITLLMNAKAPLSTLANTIHCYPTQVEVLKRAADAYQKTRLTPFVAAMLRRVLSWRRG